MEMSSFVGEGEVRGKLISEDTVKTHTGEEQKLNKPAGFSVGEEVVVRGDVITRRIDS